MTTRHKREYPGKNSTIGHARQIRAEAIAAAIRTAIEDTTIKQSQIEHGYLEFQRKQWQADLAAEQARVGRLVEALAEMIDAVQFMSGSADFGEGGQAHEGWLKLFKAMDVLATAAAAEPSGGAPGCPECRTCPRDDLRGEVVSAEITQAIRASVARRFLAGCTHHEPAPDGGKE